MITGGVRAKVARRRSIFSLPSGKRFLRFHICFHVLRCVCPCTSPWHCIIDVGNWSLARPCGRWWEGTWKRWLIVSDKRWTRWVVNRPWNKFWELLNKLTVEMGGRKMKHSAFNSRLAPCKIGITECEFYYLNFNFNSDHEWLYLFLSPI